MTAEQARELARLAYLMADTYMHAAQREAALLAGSAGRDADTEARLVNAEWWNGIGNAAHQRADEFDAGLAA